MRNKIALWVYLTSEPNAAYKHYWTAGAGVSLRQIGTADENLVEIL